MSKRIAILMATLVLVVAACSSDDPAVVTTPDNPDESATEAAFEFTGDVINTYVENAGDFAGKSAADWDNAKLVRIELDEMSFTPNELTFEAGKPYKVELVNVGAVKHEFTAESFFASVAWRKAESAESEIKAPFFTEIEVFAGQTVELFFVPISTGTFDLVCEIEGHLEGGMHGSITVTGTTPTDPAPVLTAIAAGPWVTNGSELVSSADWDTMETVEIDMGEFYFAPDEIHLTVGQPYKLLFVNSGDVKHEATAPGLFETVAFRKAQDASGEFKAPTVAEVETFAAKETELFLIPQEAGTFDIVCEIEGHLEAGMFGTIVVDTA
ncbi:MAG: cupredoxin domain-containing protein [Actinomycetota bacterium]